jgi:chemotaxis protein MotB
MPTTKSFQSDDDDLDLTPPAPPEEIWLVSYGDLMTILLVFFVLLISASQISSIEFERIKNAFQGPETAEHSISKVHDALVATVESHQLSEVVKIEEDDKSIALTLPGQLLFDLGEATLKEETRPILQEIAAVLAEIPEYARIAIEGHTDDNPVSTGPIRSNWHLSAMRALAVIELLDQKQACKNKCEVRGFGEFRPKLPNRTDTGSVIAENQAQNRRVVIRVY